MTLLALSLIAFLIAAVVVLGWMKRRRDARLVAAERQRAAGLDDPEMDEDFAHEVTPADRGIK